MKKNWLLRFIKYPKFYKLSGIMKWRCPNCKKVLVPGEQKRYETTCDHVEDPNGEYGPRPLRKTLTCSCDFGKLGFWGEEGGFYSKVYIKPSKKFNFKLTKYNAAIFSFDWWIEFDHWFFWKGYNFRQFIKKLKGGKK